MNVICIIFLIVVFCIALVMDANKQASTLFGIFLGVWVYVLVSVIAYNIRPSVEPIDVYRNKTTLKITYIDGVATDSVVVWKEGIK